MCSVGKLNSYNQEIIPMILFLFFSPLLFWDRVSLLAQYRLAWDLLLYTTGWPQTWDTPASASWVLGLQAWATIPSFSGSSCSLTVKSSWNCSFQLFNGFFCYEAANVTWSQITGIKIRADLWLVIIVREGSWDFCLSKKNEVWLTLLSEST